MSFVWMIFVLLSLLLLFYDVGKLVQWIQRLESRLRLIENYIASKEDEA